MRTERPPTYEREMDIYINEEIVKSRILRVPGSVGPVRPGVYECGE